MHRKDSPPSVILHEPGLELTPHEIEPFDLRIKAYVQAASGKLYWGFAKTPALT